MRIRVVTRPFILSSFILGLSAEAIAQGGPTASPTSAHRVAVVVPTIISLIPPNSPDQVWQVRTNDPILRRRFQEGAPAVRGEGDTLLVTLTPP
jgi:hypothetical protein